MCNPLTLEKTGELFSLPGRAGSRVDRLFVCMCAWLKMAVCTLHPNIPTSSSSPCPAGAGSTGPGKRREEDGTLPVLGPERREREEWVVVEGPVPGSRWERRVTLLLSLFSVGSAR